MTAPSPQQRHWLEVWGLPVPDTAQEAKAALLAAIQRPSQPVPQQPQAQPVAPPESPQGTPPTAEPLQPTRNRAGARPASDAQLRFLAGLARRTLYQLPDDVDAALASKLIGQLKHASEELKAQSAEDGCWKAHGKELLRVDSGTTYSSDDGGTTWRKCSVIPSAPAAAPHWTPVDAPTREVA